MRKNGRNDRGTSDDIVFNGRVARLNGKGPAKGRFVLYWMQQSQRADHNHALEYAAKWANDLKLPLLALFVLTDKYPEANIRHYAFMLEGLAETRKRLERRGVKMIVLKGDPPLSVLRESRHAAMVVCDKGYLRHQKAWRRQVASMAPCQTIQVESDVVTPTALVSRKAEYAARTIRPKIRKILDRHLVAVPQTPLARSSLDLETDSPVLSDLESALKGLDVDRTVSPAGLFFKGGAGQAETRFEKFLDQSLEQYDENSNQPQTDHISHMSPYLHFGQISPLYLALKVKQSGVSEKAGEAFLEQLIVRRELAVNFVENNPDYDRYAAIPQWARKTLAEHKKDLRPTVYTRKSLENAATGDPYWNAAMLEMKHTGFMHNYMRMYWGKKILEWCNTPEHAFRTILYLNNKYFLDGRDPNSYAGAAWIFGLHDRAFKEREIFGKVRYMAASGLERKFDVNAYVEKVRRRIRSFRGESAR